MELEEENKKYVNKSINFTPEILSNEETIKILNDLLEKVSNSR